MRQPRFNEMRVCLSFARIGVQALVFLWITDHSPARAEAGPFVQDYLVPVNLNAEKKHRMAVEKKMFPEAIDAARVLWEPSSLKGESAVSVYCQNGSREICHVTYTHAKKNIWGLFSETNPRSASKVVDLKRADAEIPKSTALAVQEAWKRMVSRTHVYPADVEPPLHSEIIEYSLLQANATPLYGEAPFRGGKLVSALNKLAQKLVRYCESAAGRRPMLAKQIESDANSIIADAEKVGR